MTESQIIFLNYEIQKALEAESKGAVALPAINWIDLLSKLIPILIQVLKPRFEFTEKFQGHGVRQRVELFHSRDPGNLTRMLSFHPNLRLTHDAIDQVDTRDTIRWPSVDHTIPKLILFLNCNPLSQLEKLIDRLW